MGDWVGIEVNGTKEQRLTSDALLRGSTGVGNQVSWMVHLLPFLCTGFPGRQQQQVVSFTDTQLAADTPFVVCAVTMRFGKRLNAEAARRWSGQYFDYKCIKKAIKDDIEREGVHV